MLVYLAILMPALMLCCGIAVDVGLMQMHRLQMQSASDAAAIGAELEYERYTGNYTSAGQNDAALNGFTNGSNSTTVNVGFQPSSGNFYANTDAVQATITQPQSGLFLKLLNKNATLKTSSVALVPPCVFLTGAKSLTTYELSTTSAYVVSSCPYYVNGSLSVDSNSTFRTLAENVTGPAGSSSWNNPQNAYIAPRYNALALSDPLQGVTQPSAGSCLVTGYSQSGVSVNQTAPAATYCGDTSYSCTGTNVVITFNPGVYVFAGGLSMSNCTLAGTGVTIFFTKNASTGKYGKLALSNVTMNLSAPTDSSKGGIPGVLIMTDRNWVPNVAQDFVLDSTTYNGDGIWYLTNAGLWLKSSYMAGGSYLGINAENLLNTSSTLATYTNFSGVSGGNPMRSAGALVE